MAEKKSSKIINVITSSNVDAFKEKLKAEIEELESQQYDVDIQYNPVMDVNRGKVRYSALIVGARKTE